jgi:NAD(P)-dependent dehydrogenase (short-subunit alcohol dehydrogenase family)
MATTSVVITGSTKGIGLGLADAFLAEGCHVTVCARGETGVADAVRKLSSKHGADRVHGMACDVTQYSQLQKLWEFAARATGRVDFWINNAGIGTVQVPLLEQTPEQIEACAKTNFQGMALATRLALEKMSAQGGGQIFNFEGFGSDGKMMRLGYAIYGASKTATRYFTRSVAKEIDGGAVKVGSIMPGVVVTEMLVGQFDGAPKAAWDSSRKLYNTIGDKVETVAPWLAKQVLANTRNGAAISWITLPMIVGRFVLPKYRKRDLFADVPAPATRG